MKKILYILFILPLVLTVSCSNNSDQPGSGGGTIVVPPTGVTEDDIIGVWETYFFQKDLLLYYNNQTQFFDGLRFIDYDGFTTTYKKESGEYIFESHNALGVQVEDNYGGRGIYEVTDSIDVSWIKHYWTTVSGNDTTVIQKILELDVRPGILKTSDVYYQNITGGWYYQISDTKLHRETSIAPDANDYVNPAKVKIDYDDLSTGTWEIYNVLRYIGGDLDRTYSTTQTSKQKGRTFKFYTNDSGARRLKWTLEPDQEEPYDSPVYVIDDVVHFFYKVEEEDGTLKDTGSYFWITDRKDRVVDGVSYDSFIDLFLDRYEDNLSLTLRDERYVRRIDDNE